MNAWTEEVFEWCAVPEEQRYQSLLATQKLVETAVLSVDESGLSRIDQLAIRRWKHRILVDFEVQIEECKYRAELLRRRVEHECA